MEHPGAGVLDIAGGGQQDDTVVARGLEQVGDGGRGFRLAELTAIAAGELVEALRIVAIPLAQLGAGREVLGPLVEGSVRLRHPAGPETVDEDPSTVRRLVPLVDPLDHDHGRLGSWLGGWVGVWIGHCVDGSVGGLILC